MTEKRDERLKEISEKLEQGVEELFTSERYAQYLATMSKFHNYSFRNTLLIAMQKPDATLVAGYQAWQKKFGRQVKKGEKGIQIIAPVPVRHKEEVEKIDPDTQEPVLRDNGQPETEEIVTVIPRFRVTTVFDVGQTYGEPLPELGNGDLTAGVEDYEIFMEALRRVSPVPMRFAKIEGTSHGYYHNVDKEIVIKDGMSESQTMKTAVHEISHAKLHDREIMEEQGIEKDKETKEVEAESIAFMVCQSFGLDTSDYSFPYIAGWSSGRDMKELRTSMDTIRKTAGEMIDSIGDELKELKKEIELTDEALLWSSREDRYAIYQINEQSLSRENEFMGLDYLKEHGEEVYAQDYDLIYGGKLAEGETLDSIYERFNNHHPADYTGHSLSVSDVVVLQRNGNPTAHYVDSFGFEELSDFVRQRQTVYQADRMMENPHSIHENSNGIEVEQHDGTWHVVDGRKINGQEFFLLEHEEFGQTVSGVIVDSNGELVAQELENGFDAGAYQAVREYFTERGIPVYDRRLIAEIENLKPEEKAAAEEISAGADQEFRQEAEEMENQIAVEEAAVSSVAETAAQKTYLPVYPYLLSYARNHGEVDAYLDSRKRNLDCKNAIETAIRENFDGWHLKHDAAATILEEYGAERVSFILANTMNHQDYDGRYSRINREWAKGVPVFESQANGRDLNLDYLLTSHPAVLDGFINLVRQEIQEREKAKEQAAEKSFIGRYYVVDDLRKKGVMDIRFYSDLDEALSGYFSVPNRNLKAFGVENTERLTGSLDLLQCRNGLDGIVQDYKKAEGWDRPEIRELVDRLEKSIDEHDAAIAYEFPDGFMTIQTSEEGYDYSFYDKSYREMDGGIYDNLHAAIQEAVEDVLGEQGLSLEDCVAVDFDGLSDKTEAAEQEYWEKRKEIFTDSPGDKGASDSSGETLDDVEKKRQPLAPTSGRTEPEKSLNRLSRAEIEEMALCMAQSEIDDMGMSEDVKLNGTRVYGSRTRDGLYKADSDVDVVLSYTGGIAEDYFFNVLHKDGMKMAGIPLDINPIDTEKTGTLEEYLAKAEQYLDEKEAAGAAEKAENKAAPAPEKTLTFFTAEDSEFHVFGVYEEGLTLPEAVNLYNQLDPEFCRGIPSIGFHYHNSSSIYDGTEHDIYCGGEVLWQDTNDIEEYCSSQLVQDTLKELQEMAEHGEVRGYRGQNTETKRLQPVSQKSEECEAGGKKESVLQALRKRQAKLKAQEKGKTAEKSQNHKKGDMEL